MHLSPRLVLLLLVFTVWNFGETRKFCPRERNGDKCRARNNAFKCAVFFYNLLGKGNYQYIEDLPTYLRRPFWQDVVGEGITNDTFYTSIDCGETGNTDYNMRCYDMFSPIVDKIIYHEEEEGNRMCNHVGRWLRNDPDFQADGKEKIEIRFAYSYCNNDWKDVTSDGQLLSHGPLHCTKDAKLWPRYPNVRITNECPETMSGRVSYLLAGHHDYGVKSGGTTNIRRGLKLITRITAYSSETGHCHPYESSGTSYSRFRIRCSGNGRCEVIRN